jgi:hypothetical protein
LLGRFRVVGHDRLIVRVAWRSAVTTGQARWCRVSEQQPHADPKGDEDDGHNDAQYSGHRPFS